MNNTLSHKVWRCQRIGWMTLFSMALVSMALASSGSAADIDQAVVGLQSDGRILVPTNQMLKPAGKQVTFPGRPVDLRLSHDGKQLIVKNTGDLVFIDITQQRVDSVLPLGGKFLDENVAEGKIYEGMSITGLASTSGKIYVSDSTHSVRVAEISSGAKLAWGQSITLPTPAVGGQAHPAGMCLTEGDHSLWVTSTRGNCVNRIDLNKKAVDLILPVGIAPFTIYFTSANKGYVSNWGGDMPKADDPQVKTSGTPARVDRRTSVVNDGSVSVISLVDGKWSSSKTIKVGLHPCALTGSKLGHFLYVANANSDTVSVIDTTTDQVVETILCRPEARLPFGSGSNALAISPDGGTLFVANGTNNCIVVVKLGAKSREDAPPNAAATSAIEGLIPTGWYPGAVLVSLDGKQLFVANIKGHGLLAEMRPKEKGRTSHDYLGSVSIIEVPESRQLAEYTREVNENNRLAQSLSGFDAPRPQVKPVPVPERHGEPSTIKHVVYVIRENKTYDQVLGDMTEGDGAKNLCVFPEAVTPNAHALARQFTLFDNFYCSGAKSPDGHSWVNEAYVTDYLERTFGGFSRSYPYEGSDPLAFAATGFLWDNALAHGKTFRNYGEFCKTIYTPKATWPAVYEDYKNGTRKIAINVEPNLPSLKPYSHPGYPGFPLTTPDVYRAKLFMAELHSFEQKNAFPNLVYIYLPQDHTGGTAPGTPTPRAMVADNDLALGQIVEAISRSQFWAETCIMIVEDDPQSGYDHVDAHRTVAFVVSPYTRRKFVDHTNYTQPGMVKTIELILGLPPMTQLDLAAPAMRSCFQAQADLSPFTAVPNQVPIDDLNPPLKKLKGAALIDALKSLKLSFANADEADDDDLNQIIWHAMRGFDTPYPQEFSASHPDVDDR